MSHYMEREEAIILIQMLQRLIPDGNEKIIRDFYHALEMAVEALRGPDILKVSFARETDKELADNIKKTMASAPVMILMCEKE